MAAPSYPLMMPTTGIASVDVFDMVYNDTQNNVSGGTYATQLRPTYWDISMSSPTLPKWGATLRAWRLFFDALRGSKKIGLFYDPDCPRPSSYSVIVGLTKAGGGSFTGGGPVDSITNRRTVVISGLPAGFILLGGSDYIGFLESGRYFLARLVSDSTANGSGVATVYFESDLPLIFTDAATYNLEKPVFEGFLDGKPSFTKGLDSVSFSFKAKSRAL